MEFRYAESTTMAYGHSSDGVLVKQNLWLWPTATVLMEFRYAKSMAVAYGHRSLGVYVCKVYGNGLRQSFAWSVGVQNLRMWHTATVSMEFRYAESTEFRFAESTDVAYGHSSHVV